MVDGEKSMTTVSAGVAPHRTHIKAGQPWWRVDWREIWEYRDLLWNLVVRDLTAIYKQSILGPLWFVINPLATTIVFSVVFGHIGGIGTDGLPPFLFYMTSLVLWNYFQGVMNSSANTLIANAGIFGKVYFPRLIVPLSLVVSNLAQLALNLGMFCAFFAYFFFFTDSSIRPSWLVFFLPLLILHCAMMGMGVGLLLSALTAKYRDLRFALVFLSQLWMYATPIIYPASSVGEKWRWWLMVNPMASVVEFNRYAFLGKGEVSFELMASGILGGMLLLVTGVLSFNRVQRSFIDTV